MAGKNLVARVTSFLQRQIAWLEEAVRRLGELEHDLARGDVDSVAAEERARQRQTDDFMREYRGLLHEWRQADHISETDRAAVQRLSAQAQALNEQLRAAYERAGEHVGRALSRNREMLGSVRRGQHTMAKYRPFQEDERQGGLVDRDA